MLYTIIIMFISIDNIFGAVLISLCICQMYKEIQPKLPDMEQRRKVTLRLIMFMYLVSIIL